MVNLVHLPKRALVSLKGRDTFKYLQALTTNNLKTPPPYQFTSFLSAQGRVLFEAHLYRTGESECLLEVDVRNMETLVAHLKRYKLRSKVEMRVLDHGEMGVYALFEQRSTEEVGAETLSSILNASREVSGAHVHADTRAPGFGYRILSPQSPDEMFSTAAARSDNLPVRDISEYTIRRYLHAIPEGCDEIIMEKALPMESNFDHMDGIDFHKGCYLGQELTVRTHHTGVIRKRIVPLRLSSGKGVPDLGDQVSGLEILVPQERSDITVMTESGVKGRPAGRFLGSIGDLGIGLLRLDKLGMQGSVRTACGKDLQVVGYVPRHWSNRPESV